jgi:hypothetical protein
MAMTFDATLKDMARESPQGFLAAFDRPPTLPFSLLNVDLSTVTKSADLIVGLGDPLTEIVHLEFQASAAAWKHADLLTYNALLFGHYHAPVHTVLILLRPEAAHPNMDGAINYAPRPERGKMEFGYEVVRLWERSAEELLAGDLGVVPLAMLGRLSDASSLENGLAAVAKRVVSRIVSEAAPENATRLLTDAFLLTGLRVRRNVAAGIFKGIHAMHESDTYLMILDEGQEKALRQVILVQGEDRFGTPDDVVKVALSNITDIDRLMRLARQTPHAESWDEILDTP